MAPMETEYNERVLQGPYSLFDNSFILEFLEPHLSRQATVLMRSTYKASHPLTASGKSHPQSPPLHLHFKQFESFRVLSGAIGTTEGYSLEDRINTPETTKIAHQIPPNIPHTFWPVAGLTEDTVILLWAHPDGGDADMDKDETASTMLLFPTASWLGPLRWWIPWKLQTLLAAIARWTGTESVMEKYIDREDWERIQKAKGKVL